MNLRLFAATSLAAAASLACATSAFAQATAHADIVNPAGTKIGTATFTQAIDGVQIAVDVSQLPAGTHGIHIHAVGKCEGPAFATAGGHFNPANKKHGKDNADGPHNGDLMNITAGDDGHAKATLLAANVTLDSGANSLFQPGGTALVIHAAADDYKTDPSGNSGPRIACGVINK
jgi:superoxide dismutase, Cu-Zn family